MKNVFVFFGIAILFLSTCVPKKCQFPAAYEFEIPVSLSPAKDTFRIGDTISIVSNFLDQVYERKTDKWYTLEDFRFYPEMIIREISNEVTDEAGILKFNILVDTLYDFSQFNYSDGAVGYIGDYTYDGENYSLEYKIIPKEIGLFVFSHFLAIYGLGEDQEFDGKCARKLVDAIVNINEDSDNNIELLEDSPDPHFNEWILAKPKQRFYDFGGYAFVVVE